MYKIIMNLRKITFCVPVSNFTPSHSGTSLSALCEEIENFRVLRRNESITPVKNTLTCIERCPLCNVIMMLLITTYTVFTRVIIHNTRTSLDSQL